MRLTYNRAFDSVDFKHINSYRYSYLYQNFIYKFHYTEERQSMISIERIRNMMRDLCVINLRSSAGKGQDNDTNI